MFLLGTPLETKEEKVCPLIGREASVDFSQS